MPNFLQKLVSGAKGLFGNIFGGRQQQQQRIISPLPDRFAETTRPQGFIGPLQPPVSTPTQQFTQQPQQQQLTAGGGGDTGQTTSFGMPGELMGALRDVGGITWEHQGNDQWTALRRTGEDGGADLAENLLQAFIDPLSKEIESWWKKLDEFDKENPFAFDEALARASSEERLNPFFDAELNEFMTGIRRSSARSLEDQTRVIGELNVDATKLSEDERLSTQEAIRSSEEGFAGAGLFFSGKRQRATGLAEVQSERDLAEIEQQKQRGIAGMERTGVRTREDLALRQQRQERLTGAARTTALEVDIAGQKRESALQRGLEQLQFAGKVPGASPIEQMRLEGQFLSGLK